MSLYDRISEPLTEDKTAQRWDVERHGLIAMNKLISKALGLAKANSVRQGNNEWRRIWHDLGDLGERVMSLHQDTVRGLKKAKKEHA